MRRVELGDFQLLGRFAAEPHACLAEARPATDGAVGQDLERHDAGDPRRGSVQVGDQFPDDALRRADGLFEGEFHGRGAGDGPEARGREYPCWGDRGEESSQSPLRTRYTGCKRSPPSASAASTSPSKTPHVPSESSLSGSKSHAARRASGCLRGTMQAPCGNVTTAASYTPWKRRSSGPWTGRRARGASLRRNTAASSTTRSSAVMRCSMPCSVSARRSAGLGRAIAHPPSSASPRSTSRPAAKRTSASAGTVRTAPKAKKAV